MDSLKVFPHLYFDFYARVVPGIVALALLFWIHPGLTWSGFLVAASGGALSGDNAFGFTFLTSLLCGFIMGHFLSYPAKLLENVFAGPELVAWERYDWLRVHQADVGALAAKNRAVYVMHFAFAVAFGFAALAAMGMKLLSAWDAPDWIIVVLLVLISVSSVFRGRDGREAFRKCIDQMYTAAIPKQPGLPPG